MSVCLVSPLTTYADKVQDAKNQLQIMKYKKQVTQEKISALQQKETALKGRIWAIQGQIKDITGNIASTEADIQRRNQRISQLQAEMAQTQKRIQAQSQTLLRRVRVMYVSGHTNYLNVLFSATSFSDFLTRFQLLTMVAEQDKKVLDDIRVSEQHLQAVTNQVQQEQSKQRRVYTTLIAQQNQAQTDQTTEQSLLNQVHSQDLQAQAELQGESDAMNNLQTLITQLESSEGGAYQGSSSGWTWPVPGHSFISSPYGWRTWSTGAKEFHNGIDIPAPIGTPIVAATNGKVLFAGPASGFGDWIVISSSNGLLEVYGHMYSWEIKVTPGQIVERGQQIAGVGSNGFSTGPHLHFTVATGFAGGYPVSVNPTQYVGNP